MASQISADGLRIEGTQFPDPDPGGTVFGKGSTTFQYSILRSAIVALQEANYDDATGNQTAAKCTLIYFSGTSIAANDPYDTIYALWKQQP